MGSNYIATDASIYPSLDCIHDSSTGYSADFSRNGEVDGWEYYDGIHTYGCWGGFLFGTLYGEYGTVGRYDIFRSVNATTHYFIRLVMKYNPWPRDVRGIHPLPSYGKIAWRTLQSTNWDSDKEIYFELRPDNLWHTYIINVGVQQWWQGDVNDLRIWPAIADGDDGDEFFIRSVDIFSTESHECRNTTCEKYGEYSYPCPWTGKRPSIKSAKHESGKIFNIEEREELIININEYGNEIIKIDGVSNGSGREVANTLAKAISRVNIGGYSEVQVEYDENNYFIIYAGTRHEDSSIEIIDNDLTRYLKFYNHVGNISHTKTYGETPVNGYSPLSSFIIKTHQAYGLLDNSENSALTFNPFQYSIEGGRRDWLNSGTGVSITPLGEEDTDTQTKRDYAKIENKNKTIIDYNHPFNASGRIKKIWVGCTLDSPDYVKTEHETGNPANPDEPLLNSRKGGELSGARLMIVRPRRDGTMKVIYEWEFNDRDPDRTYYDALYSITQETVDFDVDIFVNKGDMLAVYNANMYVGKSISGDEWDCQFHQLDFKPEIGEVFEPGRLYGHGSSGLLVYAHGYDPQKRLLLNLDLGHRYNIDKIELKGEALHSILEYNLARCLDINWQCDLFGEYHWTHHTRIDLPGHFWYQRYNVYYGLDRLNDGIYNVPDGLACDSYYLTNNLSGLHWNLNAGPGVVPTNPRYFWVNGDEEWLGVWLHAGYIPGHQSVHEFSEDPVAIYLHFPHEKQKQIYKSKIYFKERYNFRNFGISTYGGFYYTLGDADDIHYDLVPEYTKIILDSVEFFEGSSGYDTVKDYLFQNPCYGQIQLEPTSSVMYEWDPVLSDVIEDYSGTGGTFKQSGWFTTQTFAATNPDAWNAARRTDWQTIEHQWEPIICKGWRIYCDFHQSTKIMEMELYGVAEDVGSNLSGGIVINFSYYGDVWWPTESIQISENLAEIFIGDSPQHFTLELIPVNETRYDDIVIYVKTEDLNVGQKGCEYNYYTESAKIGADDADGQLITVKNTYGNPYDLYVDINLGKLVEEGLIFYSKLNDAESILNPEIGPDAKYYKLPNLLLVNQNYNCAINCHTFGLRNLIDGATAHYSYNDMLNWSEWGRLENGNAINFENLPTSSRTTIYLPKISRSRYWKFGPLDPDVSMKVREMRVFDYYGNRLDPDFYHDLNKSFFDAPVTERAPHLENDSVVGSYYELTGDQYITMDLGSQILLGRIELFHDGISDYVNFTRDELPTVGLDRYAKMCLRAWKDNTGAYLQDTSYYEHDVTLHGDAHIDIGNDDGNVSLDIDLGCLTALTEWAERIDYPWPRDLTPDDTWFIPVAASGTVTSGTCEHPGYVKFNVRCHNVGNERFYYDLREDYADEAYKIFHQLPFELTFAIEIEGSYPGGRDGVGGTYADLAPVMSVGAVNSRRRYGYGESFFRGAQMYFDPQNGRFGLAVRNNPAFTIDYYSRSSHGYTHTYATGLELNTRYNCKLTCYGNTDTHRDTENVLYRAEVWHADGVLPEDTKYNTTSMIHDTYGWYNGPPSQVSDGDGESWVIFSTISGSWLSIDMETPVQMTMFGAAGHPTAPSRLVKDFIIQGSSNNVDWVDVYSGTTTGYLYDTYSFGFASDPYRYWRVYHLTNHGDAVYIMSTRYEFFRVDASVPEGKIVDINISTPWYWEAYEIAIGGSAIGTIGASYDYNTYGPGSISGTVYDLKLHIDHDVKHYPWREDEVTNYEKCSIRIPSGTDNYVKVKNSPDLDIRKTHHTHDFWVKFRTLPEEGERWTIMEQYDYDDPGVLNRSWRIALYNSGGNYYRWEWWINKGADYNYDWSLEEYNGQTGYSRYVDHFNIVKDKWYFMLFSSGKQYTGGGFTRLAFLDISGRAEFDDSYPGNPSIIYDIPGGSDVIIGKEFDGWICEPRISKSDSNLGTDHGGHRYNTNVVNITFNQGQWESPVKPYSRMYPFSFYVGNSNEYFGHYANVDGYLQVDNSTYLPYLYFNENNEFAEKYNSYFAIDLGHRYNLDLIRRYGATDDFMIDKEANIIYSNIDTLDPNDAFMTEPSFDIDDSFYGYGGEFISDDRWYISDNIVGKERTYLSMKNGRLEHTVNSSYDDVSFYSRFGFKGDFDIEVKLGKITTLSNYAWWSSFRVDFSDKPKSTHDGDSSKTYVNARMEYRLDTNSPHYRAKAIFVSGGSSNSSDVSLGSTNDIGFRIIREGYHFSIKYYLNGVWKDLGDSAVPDARGKDVVRIRFGLTCDTDYPTTKIYWKNFKVNSADRVVMRSTYEDARWVGVELLNGDGTTRYLNKLGIYPNLTNNIAPDNIRYNSLDWEDLGPSVTSYSEGINVALDATVSGSSYIGDNLPSLVTNGDTSGVVLNRVWLSNNRPEQWLLIDLGEAKEIYRVKIYHGYDPDDDDFIIEDYTIESSLDNQSFTTRWVITGNNSFERTHDLADPFAARYIRVYIDSYRADNQLYVKQADGINYTIFQGATLREIEVYEYYGYTYISSEEWPIIAINLRDQFYIKGHQLTGLFEEGEATNWSNEASNFAWSDSIRQNPQRVRFGEWGGSFDYEQWVLIKRDTATYHNVLTPPPENQLADTVYHGVDYLKHAIIQSTTKENPINYPWWWSSEISTLSRDYDKPVEDCNNSLKISYPASSALDTVQFIEGDDWGVDSDFAYRDGIGFRWYISDADRLDTTEGYVFFGGTDGTAEQKPIEYRWYLSTLSGVNSLETGWNDIFFRLKMADEVIKNEDPDVRDLISPTMQDYIKWHTFGIKFKGRGQPFTMNIDGNKIVRNHFGDASKFDYGLYLTGSDYLDCPLSELDFKACTIEFWFRPDYNFLGVDVNRNFKNRSIFHFGNVANDVFGMLINTKGFNFYYGNLSTDFSAMIAQGLSVINPIDQLYHFAIVVSSNGRNISSDGSTIRFYMNNGLVAINRDTWSYSDDKLFKFTLGGKAPLNIVRDSNAVATVSADGVISNLRMYNYCRNDFTDSMNNTFSEYGGDLLRPAEMIEISQDNVTYYKIGDAELPFFYEKVPTGDSVNFYVKSKIPFGLTGKESRTAGIITSWDIGV